MQSGINRLHDLVRSRENIAIPETEDAETGRPEKSITPRIVGFSVYVLASVEFDDD